MQVTRHRTLLLTAAVVAPLVLASAARAEAEAGSTIEELVVTAQKRSQSVQEVPAAVTAIGAQTIQERGITDIAGLKTVVPNMQVGNLSGATNVVLRGVGNTLSGAGGPPGVAIHVDGVYQPLAAMGTLAQVDLARVEVLRGPQGTLYGRNANGGAVNFITASPTDRFEGSVAAGYASYQESHFQSIVNVPFSDRVRARAAFDWRNREDGFIKNVRPGGQDVDSINTLSGRLTVSIDLSETLTLDLAVSQLHSEGPSLYYTLHGALSTAQAANPLLVQAYNVAPQAPWRTSTNDPISGSRDYNFDVATLSWTLGDFQVKSITGWQRLGDEYLADDDGSFLSIFPNRRIFRSKTFSQEFNISGALGPIDTIAGLYYLHDDQYYLLAYDFTLGASGLPAGTKFGYEVPSTRTKAIAAFADGTWNISPKLRLIGGIRVFKDKIRHTQNIYIQIPGSPLTFTCAPQTNDIEYQSSTYRAGAQFDLTDNSHLYGTYSKGFKDGGFNRTACNQNYKPEKIDAFEIGSKNRFLDGAVTLNISAYHYDYTDLQLNQQVGFSSIITNAAAAKIKGLELEGVWQPDQHWTLNASLSFAKATYTSFLNVDQLAPQLGTQNLAGAYLNNAPKRSANLGVAYRTSQSDNGRLILRADLSQRSRIYFREFNTADNSQKGYSLLDLAAIWQSPDEKYQVRVYGTNVTKEGYLTSLFSSASIGARIVNWGAPRQFGVELRANF